MRKLLVICWLTGILSGICSMFWYYEWKYSLPTPVPLDYRDVKVGQHLNLRSKIVSAADKPLFIHFFNPDCPCSRFNIPHFNSLVKKYGDKMTFVVVVINKDKSYTEKYIQDKYGLTVPVLLDQSIAPLCGVYSTPQAVILDENRSLYYRGNYNKGRYCTDMRSNFAQMAIDSLLDHSATPSFGQYAVRAYGCQLPYCTR